MITFLWSLCNIYTVTAAILVYFLYKFLSPERELETKYGFEGPKPLPFIGNMMDMNKKPVHILDFENSKKYGHIYPTYLGNKSSWVISDEALLRQIMVKDAKSFMDRPRVPGGAVKLSKHLLRLRGKDWERVRSLVTPTFTSGKLKKMSPLISSSINNMEMSLSKLEERNVDIKHIFQSLTMDVITKTMFGINLNVFQNSSHPFLTHANNMINFGVNFKFILLSILNFNEKLFQTLFPYGLNNSESSKFFCNSLMETLKLRRESTEEIHDFLTLMLKAHEEQPVEGSTKYKGLSEEEVISQSFVFLLAGFETTATTLTFMSYYLTKNPDLQEELYREIKDKIDAKNGEELSYEDLSELTLLDQTIHETLRICPPAPRVRRICTQDITLTTSKGLNIRCKKGQIVTIPIFAIHHDESIWPNHDKFDIHRFDPAEKQKRSQFAFMPFGMGPRNCVGMRFAMLEIKLALVSVLKKYKLENTPETPNDLEFTTSPLSKTKNPIIVKLVKRE